jgi:hypothetical protein
MKAALRLSILALSVLLAVAVLLPAAPAAAVSPPSVTSVSPGYGGTPGGTAVVITGAGFVDVSSVTFGGTNATSFRVDSSTQIVAAAPPHSSALVDVVVTTPLGSSSATGADNDYYYCERREQSYASFLYTGAWTAVTSPSSSGGSYRRSAVSGASVSIVFSGDGFTWLAKRGTDQGVAAISLDGGSFFTLDLYNSVNLYKLSAFSWFPASGLHTVTIKVNGTKNPASTGTAVNIDAFDIKGTVISYSRIEQPDSRILYTGAWSTYSSASASGGCYKRSSDPKAEVSIPFFGTRLDVFGMKGITGGIVDLYVDGSETPWGTLDLSSSTAQYKQKLFSITDTSSLSHVVTLKRNPASPAGKFINLDYVEVIQGLMASVPLEQTTVPLLTYSGSWSTLSSSSYSGGSFAYTNTAGSSVTLADYPFMRLDVVAKTGPNYGIAKITLDGSKTFLVDLYSSTTKYKQVVWSSGWLAPGDHSVKIEWTGTKRPAATKTNINLDAVAIWGSS